jgi:hypothetical protein
METDNYSAYEMTPFPMVGKLGQDDSAVSDSTPGAQYPIGEPC